VHDFHANFPPVAAFNALAVILIGKAPHALGHRAASE